MGGKILFNTSVDSIHLDKNMIKSVRANGVNYEGDVFISSMHLKDLVNALPNVNKEVSNIAKVFLIVTL